MKCIQVIVCSSGFVAFFSENQLLDLSTTDCSAVHTQTAHIQLEAVSSSEAKEHLSHEATATSLAVPVGRVTRQAPINWARVLPVSGMIHD